MSEWKQIVLSEITTKVTDGAHHSPSEFKGGFPMFSVKDMQEQGFNYSDAKTISEEDFVKLISSGCQPEIDDILIAKDGSVLKHIFRVREKPDYVLLSSIAIVRPDKKIVDPSFLVYAIKEPSMKDLILTNFVGGSGVPRIVLKDFKQIELPIPDIDTQTAIASVLSSLDDKIDLLHRQNATLEKMAETLFKQWFIEEAKEEWINGKVSDLIKILSGFAFKSSSFVESGKYRLITIKGVQDGYLELNNADNIEELPDRMPDFCNLQIGDILLSLTGNVGRCCLVDTTDLLLNQRVAKLHPINERDRAYTYFLFRQPQIKQLLEEMGKGTAQSNLSPIETSNMELIIPDKEKLTEFSAIATPWLNKLLFNKKAIQTLSNLRDSLLPKLMSGEVTVEMK